MNDKVLILMSTYNGEKYLSEQLDSLLNQSDVSINILIRDDGSFDKTIEIIQQYSTVYSNITFYEGDNIGFAKSFWSLLTTADGSYQYYAFCDQDDVWKKHKVRTAIDMITAEKKSGPILYTSNVQCIDKNGIELDIKPFAGRLLGRYEVFQTSILPGCTFVFNNEAKKVLSKYDGFIYAHDWAVYAIVRTLGTVIYDSQNCPILYRVHENNTIGIENKQQYLKKRIKNFFLRSYNVRTLFAKDFYGTYAGYITDFELKRQVFYLGHYRDKYMYKWKLLTSENFRGFVFRAYVILNRI